MPLLKDYFRILESTPELEAGPNPNNGELAVVTASTQVSPSLLLMTTSLQKPLPQPPRPIPVPKMPLPLNLLPSWALQPLLLSSHDAAPSLQPSLLYDGIMDEDSIFLVTLFYHNLQPPSPLHAPFAPVATGVFKSFPPAVSSQTPSLSPTLTLPTTQTQDLIHVNEYEDNCND